MNLGIVGNPRYPELPDLLTTLYRAASNNGQTVKAEPDLAAVVIAERLIDGDDDLS